MTLVSVLWGTTAFAVVAAAAFVLAFCISFASELGRKRAKQYARKRAEAGHAGILRLARAILLPPRQNLRAPDTDYGEYGVFSFREKDAEVALAQKQQESSAAHEKREREYRELQEEHRLLDRDIAIGNQIQNLRQYAIRIAQDGTSEQTAAWHADNFLTWRKPHEDAMSDLGVVLARLDSMSTQPPIRAFASDALNERANCVHQALLGELRKRYAPTEAS